MKTPNPDTLKQVKDISRPAIAFAVARRKDTVYLGGSDFKVNSGDLAAAKFETKDLVTHGSYVTGLALAGKTLVSGGYDGKMIWFDTVRGETIRTVDAHSKWIRKVITSPDEKLVASVADDMACRVWDSTSGKLVHELRGHKELTPNNFTSMLYAVAFSPDGKLLATADKVGHIVVWDVAGGSQLGTCEAPVMYTWDPVQRLHSIGGVRSLAFSPDGTRIAAGGTNKIGNIDHLEAKSRVEVFDWKAGKQVAEFNGDKFAGIVNRLAWAPDGAYLLAGGGAAEGFLLFYDVTAKKTLRQEKAPMHVHDFTLTADWTELVVAGHNKLVVYKLG